MDVLEGVIAVVVCSDPKYTAKPAIQRTLEQLGARVVQRLTKEVTHIVYERRQVQRARDKNAEQELQELYSRADKLDPRPAIVSPSWVEGSRTAKRRLVEKNYIIPRPKEALLLAKPTGRTPGSGAAAGKKRKQAAAPPKPLDAFELGELFSSSQQIQGDGLADIGHEVSSPRLGQPPHKRARASEGSWAAAAAVGRPTATKAGKSGPALQGTDTQQVADIMAGLLAGGQADTPYLDGARDDGNGWEEEDGDGGDDLDTPLSLRLAKSGSRSTSKEADRRHSGPIGRSRLAQASGPHDGAQAGAAASPAVGPGQLGPANRPGAAAGIHTASGLQAAERFSLRQLTKLEQKQIPLHKGTPLPGTLPPPTDAKRHKSGIPVPAVERVPSPWQDAEQLPSQSQSQPSQQAVGRDGQAGGAEPQQARGPQPLHRRRSLLPVALPDGSPASSFKPPGPAGGAPWSSLRPWDKRAQQQQQQQQPATKAAPTSERARPEEAAVPAGRVGGDRQPLRGSAAAPGARGVLQENVGAAGRSRVPQADGMVAKQRQPAAAAAAEEVGPAAGAEGARAQQPQRRGRRRGQHRVGRGGADAGAVTAAEQHVAAEQATIAVSDSEEEADGMGPLHGYIAMTSVEASVQDLCRSAVRRLRGLRLCSEGREDGKITHLVIGKERRTLKLMLAVANGAWLVSPEWVTASLEAGRWLPESQYLAKVRFVAAAEKARCQLEVPDVPPLLHDQAIYFHEAPRKGPAAVQAGGAAALKRVAQALGAKVVPPKACTLCVVVGPGGRPTHIPRQAPAVKEEWLLMAAERFAVPSPTSKQFLLR